MDLEYKVLPLTELKVADAGPGMISGYGAVIGNWDRQKDMVVPGAFAETTKSLLDEGFMAWGHDFHTPIATFSEVREDGKGLYFSADFHSTDEAQRARTIAQERIARGKSMGLSIGYAVNPGGSETTKDGRLLKSVTVREISLVTVPANPLAVATGVKDALSESGYTPQATRLGESDAHTMPMDHYHVHADGTAHKHSHTHAADTASHDMGDHPHGMAGAGKAADAVHTKADFDALTDEAKIALYYELLESGSLDSSELKAQWTRAYINSLPDSAFAAIESGGKKDSGGRTVPRSLRHYPHHDKGGAVDEPHLKAALSRIGDPSNYQGGKAHLEAHAKKLGIGDDGKNAAGHEQKQYGGMPWGAEPLEDSFEDRIEDFVEACQAVVRPPWGAGYVCSLGTFEDYGYIAAMPYTSDDPTYWRVEYTLDDMGDPVIGDATEVQPGFSPIGGKGQTFVGEVGRVLAGIYAIELRSKSLDEIRRKEGRTISGSNRDRLQALRERMQEAMGALDEFLSSAEPKAKSVNVLAEYLEFQRTEARLNGVAV